MSAPANHDGKRAIIDPKDAVMLLIDHQSGLFQTVEDMHFTKLRRHAAALARCETVAHLPVAPAVQALALALKADILRQSHDLEATISAGSVALEHAVAAGALPVVVHAAMALGDLADELGHPADAITYFSLAERAAVYNPDVQARARARIDALKEHPC